MSWNRKSQAQEVKPKKLRRSRVVKQYPKPKHKQTIVQPETIYVAIFKHVTLYTCYVYTVEYCNLHYLKQVM